MNRLPVILMLATVVALAGLAPVPADAQRQVLKIGHDSHVTHPYQKAMEKFKEVLETETRNAVEVQIFPNAQLGDEAQMFEGIRLGTIDAAAASTANISGFVPEVDVFSLPFVFRDLSHMYRVADGPIGQRIAKSIEAKTSSIVLGWWTAGLRTTWNSKRPVHTPADLKGLKMRVMSSPIMLDTFNALGAQATPIPFSELYTSLRQGVVDGADNDVVDIMSEKFFEVTKYVSLTNHFVATVVFAFSKRRFERLSPDIQQAIIKAGQAALPVQRAAQEALADTSLAEIKQRGLQVITVEQKPFRDAVQRVYAKYADRIGGMQILEEIAKQ